MTTATGSFDTGKSYRSGDLGLPKPKMKRGAAPLPPLVPMPELRRYSKPIESRAYQLLGILESQRDGASQRTICALMQWGPGQFADALDCARNSICPQLELTIPHPVPEDGWCYRLTGAWIGVDGGAAIAAGTGHAVNQIEARLKSVLRDCVVARKHLDPESLDGQKVNALVLHLGHVLAVVAEISSRGSQ